MTITGVAAQVANERVLFVYPPIAPTVDTAGWRRRLRLYSGRSLSDTALRAEQDNRAGHLVTLAQAFTPGVVEGLEVTVEWPTTSGGDAFLHVTPGRGLAANGEDVALPQSLRVSLRDLLPAGDPSALRAAVLVLEPVEVLAQEHPVSDNPCELDESALSLSDEQRVDGALLSLLPWEDDWGGAPLDDASAARNTLAYSIFERERQFLPGDYHPWETVGVPLALLGLRHGSLEYLDRYAVRRQGGRRRDRTPLVSTPSLAAGSPELGQARIQQLVSHLLDLSVEAVPVEEWSARLGRLPPAGLLPTSAVDLATRRSPFFPAAFSTRLSPVPLEQLDGLLERCASLAPLDCTAAESVLVLVPVPQAAYEPGLLVEEQVAPEFAAAVTNLRAVREKARGRREFVRQCHTALVETIDGPLVRVVGGVPTVSSDSSVTPSYEDSEPLEVEPVAVVQQGTEDGFGVVPDSAPTPPSAIHRPQAWLELRSRVSARPFLTSDERLSFGSSGLVAFIEALKTKIDKADDALDFSFLKVHTDIYRTRQLMLGTAVASRLLTSPVFATLVQGETAVTQREDVARFYQGIKGKLPLSGIESPPASEGSTGATSRAPGGSDAASTGSKSRGVERSAGRRAELVLSETGFLRATEESERESHLETLRATETKSDTSEVLRISPEEYRALSSSQRSNLESARIEEAREEVQLSEPIVGGQAYDFRTTSIAKRLDTPPASEARSYAAANRYEAVTALEAVASTGLNLDGVPVYGVAVAGSFDEDGFPLRVTQNFEALRPGGFAALLDDPPPQDPLDEGVHMLETVRVVEHHIATLRAVEARIAGYREVLADCRRILDTLTRDLGRATARLGVLDDAVEDARHRVGTALALLADEEQRVQTINQRRHAVLAHHVRVLAYVRPRTVEAIVEAPAVGLDPGLLPPVISTYLERNDEPPPELESMLQVLRESPVSFFRYAPKLLEKLDRVELLHGTIATARQRASALLSAGKGKAGGLLTFSTLRVGSKTGASISRLLEGQYAKVASRKAEVSELDLGSYAGQGWRESRDRAVQVLTLGDLIETNHGRCVVAQAAQEELGRLGQIGTGLYTAVSSVLPAIRLGWAERLGQHDQGVALGSLAALPRFSELSFATRRELQELTDWLYDRVNQEEPEAVSLMHEFVRVCILLGSHAPIDEIIAGHLPVDAQASPGGSVVVTVDPLRVRLGMHAYFYSEQKLVAHGVVDDLTGAQAKTRVVGTTEGRALGLAKDTTVRFVAPEKALLPPSFTQAR